MVDAALKLAAHQVDRVVVLGRPQAEAELGERDLDWAALREQTADSLVPACVPVASSDPLYILTPQALRARQRAWFVTTVATPSR